MWEKISWENDNYLYNIDLSNIKLLSCDIWDTLLFRTTAEPSALFEQVGAYALSEGALNAAISAKEFGKLREMAEIFSRSLKLQKHHSREVSLSEIYKQMSPNIGNVNRILDIELETEKKYAFLNESVYSFIKYCFKKNIVIVLVSDMYLSSEQLRDILVGAGMDIQIIDSILVSCEYGVGKNGGGLYQILLDKYKFFKSHEILHLGDNFLVDVAAAKEYGIHAIHYNVINNKNTKYELEYCKDELVIPEIFSLRKLIGNQTARLAQNEKFWFNYGATILGPILSVFCEWTLNIAKENNIKNIYPLMRDGAILCVLLKNYMNFHKIDDLNVKPMYVSRRSTFLASLNADYRSIIHEQLSFSELTISCLFNRFKIINPYKEYSNITLSQAKTIMINQDRSLYEDLEEYFFSKEVHDRITMIINEEKQKFHEYLEKEFNIGEPFITMDCGYRGTIQNAIEQNIKAFNKQYKCIHSMIFSNQAACKKVLNGLDIRGFIKSMGIDADFINSNLWMPAILENLMISTIGSTIGYYRDESSKVVPITDSFCVEASNNKEREICQKGIIAFHHEFMKFLERKKWIKDKLFAQRSKFQWILERVMSYPSISEAQNLGEIQSEGMFMHSNIGKISSNEQEKIVRDTGPTKFLKKRKSNPNVWIAGTVERVYPYFMELQLFKKAKDKNVSIMACLAEFLYINNVNDVIVYGAGRMGEILVRMLVNLKIRIQCIVDKNNELWGKKIENIEICSLNQAMKFQGTTYVIASEAYVDEIRECLLKQYVDHGQVTIIDYTMTN